MKEWDYSREYNGHQARYCVFVGRDLESRLWLMAGDSPVRCEQSLPSQAKFSNQQLRDKIHKKGRTIITTGELLKLLRVVQAIEEPALDTLSLEDLGFILSLDKGRDLAGWDFRIGFEFQELREDCSATIEDQFVNT